VSLPLPNLDDRRWIDLVEEGRALIPVYAPRWTDHNAHDPGITLIELFAWIAEMDLYQIDRISDAYKLKFLALAGIRPIPPLPARTILSLTPKSDAQEIPIGSQFQGRNALGQTVRFRTLAPLMLVKSQLRALAIQTSQGFRDLSARLERGESLPLFDDRPKPGNILYLGFDRALPPNLPVSLFFAFSDASADEKERNRLLQELQEQEAECRPANTLLECPPQTEGEPIPEYPLHHHSVQIVWEFFNETGFWQPLDAAGEEIEDWTRSFTLSDRVVLKLPAPMMASTTGAICQPYYYLRCRFLTGAYDATPMLDRLILNGVKVEQAVAIEREIGIGTGEPLQQYTLPHAPILPDSLHLFTEEPEQRSEWWLRPDFDASRRSDRHFLLNAPTGTIAFGDGEKGRVPPKDARIFASYDATLAEGGNLAKDTVREIAPTDLNELRDRIETITNPLPATGGTAAETLTQTTARALKLLTKPQRAVTLADYETLALETPGVRLARVAARANLDPSFPCIRATGVITVIILPYLPSDRPMPSPGLRRLVAAYLNRRRIVGTRVIVAAPVYVEVSVRAKVQSYPGKNINQVQQQIMQSLNQFFHPLFGGSDGKGWVFGRDVYRSEVLQVIDETPGSDRVLSLELLVDGKPQCGNICLGSLGLVAAGKHDITVV
jgi:predicted phage baseplate assembly protein